MKKIIILIFSFLLIFALLNFNVFAQSEKEVNLLLFYGQGCPHCSAEKSFLDEISSKYSSLKITEFEVYFDHENSLLLNNLAKAYGEEVQGIPTTFIGDKVIAGFSENVAKTIENEILTCMETGCKNPIDKLSNSDTTDKKKLSSNDSSAQNQGNSSLRTRITIPAVISAAFVDAINPCAFAVLIILLTTILSTKSKKRALLSGLAFSLSIFISYFLMGIGLYSAIQAAEFTHIFYIIVSILAIFVGLFNLKDYFAYGKWFIMEVPMSWRPKLKSLIRGITSVPGAFLIGFAVSLFLLPCTSGPYIVILGLLASVTERTYAILLLLLYNFIFIAPMLIITSAIYFGFTTTEKAEEWRQKRLKTLHLIAGIIILLLGIGMLSALLLGYL